MPTFFSPSGNPEVWDEKPADYLTVEEWEAAHPVETTPVTLTTEQLFSQLRAIRDAKISETDYLMMPDYPIADEDKSAITAYRQALRDLPAQDGAPWDGGGKETPWPGLPSVLKVTMPDAVNADNTQSEQEGSTDQSGAEAPASDAATETTYAPPSN